MTISEELEQTEFIAKKAGQAIMRYFEQPELKVDQKKDNSLVTEADLASENIILRGLRDLFPADKIYSEESGLSSSDRATGSYIWIVDPLDGTTNFANKYPFFCVSIGRGVFQPNGQISIELGVIYDPVRDECFLAEKERGAWCNRKRIYVKDDRPPQESFIVTGFSYAKGPELKEDVERFLRVADQCQSIRRDGAAALDLAYVARGIYDAYWEFGLKPWDIAAGSLIVAEAGGRVFDPGKFNKPFDPESSGILCGTSSMVSYLQEKM